MLVRQATKSDIAWVRDNLHPSYDKDFPFPDLTHSVMNLVLEEKDEVVAFFCLRNVLEGILMLNGDKRERIKMLDKLLPITKYAAEQNGHSGFHAFVKEHFAEVLSNHYGFKKTDTCLYLGVNNG